MFGNISQPSQNSSRSVPQIDHRPFSDQFRASKNAAECRDQQIKRSHDGPFLAFQLVGNILLFRVLYH